MIDVVNFDSKHGSPGGGAQRQVVSRSDESAHALKPFSFSNRGRYVSAGIDRPALRTIKITESTLGVRSNTEHAMEGDSRFSMHFVESVRTGDLSEVISEAELASMAVQFMRSIDLSKGTSDSEFASMAMQFLRSVCERFSSTIEPSNPSSPGMPRESRKLSNGRESTSIETAINVYPFTSRM